MNFTTAVKTCFKKYFQFRGRARRSEYWWFVLFTFLGGIVFGIFDTLIFGSEAAVRTKETTTTFVTGEGPLGSLFNLVVLIPSLSVSWRRLHDTGRSGWWLGGLLLALVVFVVLALYSAFSRGQIIPDAVLLLVALFLLGWMITLIVFYCQDSHRGDNQYGPSPKYGGQAAAFD